RRSSPPRSGNRASERPSLGGSGGLPGDSLRHFAEPTRKPSGIERLLGVLATKPLPRRQVPNEEVRVAHLQAAEGIAAGTQHMDDQTRFDMRVHFVEHGMFDDGMAASGGINSIGGIDGGRIDVEWIPRAIP